MLSFNLVNCGWAIEGGKYRINWYSGPEALTVVDVTITEELDEDEKHMCILCLVGIVGRVLTR